MTERKLKIFALRTMLNSAERICVQDKGDFIKAEDNKTGIQ